MPAETVDLSQGMIGDVTDRKAHRDTHSTPSANGPARAPREAMTKQQLAVWRSLLDTTSALARALTAELALESGLSSGDYQVLLALVEAPGKRIRSSELADSIDWERSRLSHHLRRMEMRGLVRREGSGPHDSRATHVTLTTQGETRFQTASKIHTATVKRYFADALSAQQFASLAEILDALRRHLTSM
ncbi:MarR family winged helix-turn-helix transcriptional regulator [Micromonospora coriariae]|nr:MarR family winged helix-turn-helix transcriptional regulator [Micromonospora coriariae]